MVNTYRDELQRVFEHLQIEREQIRPMLDLARPELLEEWDRMERQWEGFQSRGARALCAPDSGGIDIEERALLKQMGEALRQGYQRIRRQLQ